jgi:SAM-dependent methyltransferase
MAQGASGGKSEAVVRGPGAIARLMAAMHAPIYAARLRELVRLMTPHLKPADRVLDVGCGVGTLGAALMASPQCPAGVNVEGLERFRRGGEPIPVTQYDGRTIPMADRSFDVVILADVLHHEEDPQRLLSECIRVSRRLVIIKDHQIKGPFAHARISLIDWAANAPYGVRCLFRYHTPESWRASHARHGLSIVEEHRSMRLYPPGFNLLFGRGLQYMAVLRVADTQAAPPDAPRTAAASGR